MQMKYISLRAVRFFFKVESNISIQLYGDNGINRNYLLETNI